MPGLEHEVNPATKRTSKDPYGCWNKPRFREAMWVKDGYALKEPGQRAKTTVTRWTKAEPWSSLECRYDMSLTDTRCDACKWAGSGEKYDAMIRSHGK